MTRYAFTMVELVFVIVILGILAVIAIPKLAATRNDAYDSRTCHDVATCITDAAGSYTATHNVTLSDIDSCSKTYVSGLVSLNGQGDELTVNGVPTICSHLNSTFILGGTRVSL
jgi:prepilin-type N-terminal cleavage/methylation domain-containing protein